MILWLFLTLLSISALLLWLGYSSTDPHYAFVGLFFFFILGTILFTNQVEYETSATVNTTYILNGTTTTGSATNITYNYTALSGTFAHTFGVFLSLASGAGLGLMLLTQTRRRKND